MPASSTTRATLPIEIFALFDKKYIYDTIAVGSSSSTMVLTSDIKKYLFWQKGVNAFHYSLRVQ